MRYLKRFVATLSLSSAPDIVKGKSLCHLGWVKWHWDGVSSKYLTFLPCQYHSSNASYSFNFGLIYSTFQFKVTHTGVENEAHIRYKGQPNYSNLMFLRIIPSQDTRSLLYITCKPVSFLRPSSDFPHCDVEKGAH